MDLFHNKNEWATKICQTAEAVFSKVSSELVLFQMNRSNKEEIALVNCASYMYS